MGYESNDASVLTNVSSDHLDLQGIHTLPELAEVKSTICRITKPDGWVVLNADDPLVAAVARRVRGQVALFSTRDGDAAPSSAATSPAAAAAYLSCATASLVELEGDARADDRRRARASRSRSAGSPATTSPTRSPPPAARAAWARRSTQVRDGLVDFRPSSERSPGRLNLFRLGSRVVIVDFAHNEAGIAAVLDVAEGIAGGRGRSGRADHRDHRDRRRPAGRHAARDRPDRRRAGPAGRDQGDAQVPARPDRASRSSASCWPASRPAAVTPADVPVYDSETAALRAELNGAAGAGATADGPTRRGSSC